GQAYRLYAEKENLRNCFRCGQCTGVHRLIMRKEIVPAERLRITFHIVALHVSLAPAQRQKLVKERRELPCAPVETPLSPFHHIHAVLAVVGCMPEKIIANPRQIARYRWESARQALMRRVAPGFIIAGKDSQVAAANELQILHAKKR